MGELLGDGSASAGLSAVFCHLHPGSGGDGWTRLSARDWPVRGRRLRWHSRAVPGSCSCHGNRVSARQESPPWGKHHPQALERSQSVTCG